MTELQLYCTVGDIYNNRIWKIIYIYCNFLVALQMWFFSASHSQGHLLPTCWRRVTVENVIS